MKILAQFHGTCAECGETIIPGQRITRDQDDDTWRHHDCGARVEKVECVCARCWLVHNGACF
jgi:DNA-directed RNA polymerase subunit RPC12/RpoP